MVSSIFRGQSHDIKSLIVLNPNTLLSGGVTTDICIYKLQDGRFKDQFGKNSHQQKVQEKVRHVPPFPFKTVAKLSTNNKTQTDLLLLLSGSGHSLEMFSTKSHKQLLRLDKKGDYGIHCFDIHASLTDGTHFIMFSDNIDTQVFTFDAEELTVTKLTKKVCF